MKPTSTHSRYQFLCSRCERYFWTERADWPDGQQCPSCDGQDSKDKYQREARKRWWSEHKHLKGATLEDIYVDAGSVDVLYLRTTDGDGALWKAYIKRGWDRESEELVFEVVGESSCSE